jgi:hypothetical protein
VRPRGDEGHPQRQQARARVRVKVAVAADDDKITAVVSQVPFVSGAASIKMKSISDILKSTVYNTLV